MLGRTFGLLLICGMCMLGLPDKLPAQNNSSIQLRQQPQNKENSTEQLARTYYFQKQYDKAVGLYGELYKQKPNQNYYTYYLNCLLSLKDYKEAEKVAKKQHRQSPDHPYYTINLAHIYHLIGEQKKGDQLISKLLNNLPTTRTGLIQTASALQSKGYFKEAVEVYTRGREHNDEGYPFYLEMATAYQYNGQYDMMFSAYLSHLNEHPEDMQRIKNNMQNMLRLDVDDNLSDKLKKQLLGKTQAHPESQLYAQLLLWHAMQTKDFEMAFRQARSIDKRFGGAEVDVLEVADIALSHEQYDLAATAYQYVKEKDKNAPFYALAYSGLFKARVKQAENKPGMKASDFLKLEKEGEKALKELGIYSETVDIVRIQAHIQAFRLNKFEEATYLLDEAIQLPNMKAAELAGIKLELADIMLAMDKVWDASLLYAQVESDMKNEPIGHEAKFRNAKLFYYVSEFDWAQTRLDVLKSSTSKLIANDALELSLFITDILEEDTMGFTLRLFGAADLYNYQQHYDSALILLDKIEKRPSGTNCMEYVLYKKAGLMMETRAYREADSLYTALATNYPQSIKADNAIYYSAEIQRLYLDQPDKAKALYLILMTDYPDSLYAGEARIKYRMLDKREEAL